MRFKTIVFAAAVATLPVLGACDQPTGPAAPGTAAEQEFAPTSAIDPATGEPVAFNFSPAGRVATIPGPRALYTLPGECSFDDPYCIPTECDPIYDYGCEPCPRDDPGAWCYTPPCTPAISGFTTYRAGIEPYSFLEVSGTTASGCGYLVLTGIGARINGSDDYTTLYLRGRRINPDGSWGETVDYRFGSSPYHSLEAWGEVPYSATDFYGIVGVGIGQSGTEDVRTLVLHYRKLELTARGIRATGPTYQARFGSSPYGYLDASYVTSADNEVFVGAGFRSIDAGERTATMAAHVGILP